MQSKTSIDNYLMYEVDITLRKERAIKVTHFRFLRIFAIFIFILLTIQTVASEEMIDI